jgi:hypothetical protein
MALAAAACGSGSLPVIPTTAGPHATPISAVNGASIARLPGPQLDRQLAAIRANGVQMVRSDAPWGSIEPQPPAAGGPTFRFGLTDTWAGALAKHGLRWAPILDYGTSWGNPITEYPAFEAYAIALTRRYGAGGTFWAQNPALPYLPVQVLELWNEENVPHWYIKPGDYSVLYGRLREAVHAADPEAKLIVGGLGTQHDFASGQDDPARYVLAMLSVNRSLVGHIDGIGLHPYGTSAADTVRWVSHFRRALSVAGLGGVPLYLTEFGWSVNSGEAWRAEQMRYLGSTLARSNCGIRLLSPYDWSNPGGGGDFGLAEPSGFDVRLRPAGRAWFAAVRAAPSLPTVNLCPPLATAAGAPRPPR